MNTHTHETEPATAAPQRRGTSPQAQPPTKTRHRRRAFTIVELLVVIVIIAAATVLILPAASNVVQSNNYAAAINIVSSTLGNARARALSNARPAGVVFLFDSETERYSLQIIELEAQNGSLSDRARPSSVTQRDTYARAFRPAPGTPLVELPSGVAVFGLSFSIAPNNVDPITGDPLIGDRIDNDTAAWYAGERLDSSSVAGLPADQQEIPWLFPRNDPLLFLNDTDEPGSDGGILQDDATPDRDELWEASIGNNDAIRAVRHAMTFAIFFDASGKVVSADNSGAISTPNAFLELPEIPVDIDTNFADRIELDKRSVFDPEKGLNGSRTVDGASVSGNDVEPNPEVRLRSAHQLAVVDLRALRRGVGPVIRDTPVWFVRGETDNDDFVSISLPGSTDDGGPMTEDDEAVNAISAWIDNNAEILSFNQYTGAVIRRRDL